MVLIRKSTMAQPSWPLVVSNPRAKDFVEGLPCTRTRSNFLWEKKLADRILEVLPNGTSTFFECVAEWPEPWAGWSPVDGNIIWSDCIYSGAGPTYDTAVAFALDWKTRTMYLSHTFTCSDQQGLVALGVFLNPRGTS